MQHTNACFNSNEPLQEIQDTEIEASTLKKFLYVK